MLKVAITAKLSTATSTALSVIASSILITGTRDQRETRGRTISTTSEIEEQVTKIKFGPIFSAHEICA